MIRDKLLKMGTVTTPAATTKTYSENVLDLGAHSGFNGSAVTTETIGSGENAFFNFILTTKPADVGNLTIAIQTGTTATPTTDIFSKTITLDDYAAGSVIFSGKINTPLNRYVRFSTTASSASDAGAIVDGFISHII